jgi:hypothetical protein
MDNTTIYLLFNCDAWKSFSSMGMPIFVGTDAEYLFAKIRECIENGDMCFESEDYSVEEQLELWEEQLDTSKLIYGYVEEYINNDMDL